MAKISNLPSTTLSFSVLKTLAYADIFDYPLTANEAWRFLIGDTKVTAEVVRETLKILTDSKRICADGGFYLLSGRRNIVGVRRNRRDWSKQKLEVATKTVKKLKIFPWIKMIGITGALAMENCDEGDDIDLIIITSENLLWLTRLTIYLLCPILGIKRRKPGEKEVKNKICFNLFLEENHLKIFPQNLFVAHEIAQVKPIFNKDKTYEKFLGANLWVQDYLPNALNHIAIQPYNHKIVSHGSTVQWFDGSTCILDKIAFKLQYFYMQQKITNERVGLHQAFFHPRDLSKKVEKILAKKMKGYNEVKLSYSTKKE